MYDKYAKIITLTPKEAKKCPFCKHNGYLWLARELEERCSGEHAPCTIKSYWYVQCCCKACGPRSYLSPEDALAKWNRKPL